MDKKIEMYEVFDKKNRWMGSYSNSLNETNSVSPFEMAKINCLRSNGKIFVVYEDGSKKEMT